MKKRFLTAVHILLSGGLLFSSAVPAFANQQEAAETASEATSQISLTGQLIELSSTDLPTTIVVRKNPDGASKDYTVQISSATKLSPAGFGMSDWITGDFLALTGTLNENTGIVEATRVQNVSLNPFRHRSLNGFVESVDVAGNAMTVSWDRKSYTVNVTANTRMVVPPKNPAALSDFLKGDRVRIRLTKDGAVENEARIIVALRRGEEIFLKARTRPFNATLNAIDEDKKTLTVTLKADAHLRADDVNNLVGVPGEIITVSYDDKTNFVRRFKGSASVDELAPGDELFIAGRVGDDGIILAKMVRDNSIFRAGVDRRLGSIVSIYTSTNVIKAEFVKTRIEAGSEWAVTYTETTEIWKDGKKALEADLKVGDVIRVEGVANANTMTVAATKIAAHSVDFRPLTRVRKLKDIVSDRIRTSLGKEHADDIVRRQKPADAQDDDEEDEDESDAI